MQHPMSAALTRLPGMAGSTRERAGRWLRQNPRGNRNAYQPGLTLRIGQTSRVSATARETGPGRVGSGRGVKPERSAYEAFAAAKRCLTVLNSGSLSYFVSTCLPKVSTASTQSSRDMDVDSMPKASWSAPVEL